uniref:Napsin A aspartic peptidase n=1 Tax=Sciurus vulgaris TaxID=55149 RepID=A0A8D2DRE4_SCIVU
VDGHGAFILFIYFYVLLRIEPSASHMIPLHRVHPGHRTLNTLRAWGEPAEPSRLGTPSTGDKPIFVSLSKFMNGSTTVLIPRLPAPSSPMGPSLPFSMELGGLMAS